MKGVPLDSVEGRELIDRGPAWNEDRYYWATEPPEDEEDQQYVDFLLSLPEAWPENQ